MITTTIRVTIDGTTQDVTATSHADTFDNGATSDPIFAAKIGRGSALYPATIRFHRMRDGQPITRGWVAVTDAHGRQFQYTLATTVRNQQARIVAYAEFSGLTNLSDNARI